MAHRFNYSPANEKLGNEQDLTFLQESAWLHNTEVSYHITKYRGRWHVTILYIAVNDPLTFRCNEMGDYHSERKAKIYANCFQQGIRKDPRGNLTKDLNVLRICNN